MKEEVQLKIPPLATVQCCYLCILAYRWNRKLLRGKLRYKKTKQRVLEVQTARRRAHPEVHRAQGAKWRARNKEKIKRDGLLFRAANPQLVRARRQSYYLNNKEKVLVRTKQWSKNNAAKRREIWRRYAKKHPERVKAKRMRRFKERYAQDPVFKMKMAVYRVINKTIARKHTTDRTRQILGCTYEELKAHIESLWLPGMDWSNYALFGWHLDHKIPISSFDLTDPVQIKACFSYRNLQPMWRKDNMMKGDKIAPEYGNTEPVAI